MPRGPRLDTPGALHHVIVRGIERRRIFRTDRDRVRCLDRLGAVLADSGATLYAWCLMPNHIHALLRSGNLSLGRLMQRWAGAYACEFNRRHQRCGHLFQNRFKSILVEEERYLLALVRYIHLNPVRARLAVSLDDLDHYRWTGHAVLLGHRAFVAQDTDFVLAHFGRTVGTARAAYRRFVRTNPARAETDLSGGGLRRSVGGWQALSDLRRGRERWTADERVLGSSHFVAAVIAQPRATRVAADPAAVVADISRRVAARFGVTAAEIASRSLRRPVLAARAVVCHAGVCRLGLTPSTVAAALSVSTHSVQRALLRAPRVLAARCDLNDLWSDGHRRGAD